MDKTSSLSVFHDLIASAS